jgi:hypothetical protein
MSVRRRRAILRPSQVLLGLLALLVGAGLLGVALLLMSAPHPGPAARSVLTTRLVAVMFMLSDVAISSSLVVLLLVRDHGTPAWLERRLPFRGRWVWYALMGLTVLCYASLAPTFLFFYLQMRK